jgi:hypothetical protein
MQKLGYNGNLQTKKPFDARSGYPKIPYISLKERVKISISDSLINIESKPGVLKTGITKSSSHG